MTLFAYINQNVERIQYDVKIGLMPCSIINHYCIYSRFDYYRKLGNSCCDAVVFVSNDFQINERTIFRIISKMEAEI